MKITTIEQAQALPEIDSGMFVSERITDPVTGITTESYKPRPFTAQPVDGDAILLFEDKDGRVMRVCYTENGPAKAVLRI